MDRHYQIQIRTFGDPRKTQNCLTYVQVLVEFLSLLVTFYFEPESSGLALIFKQRYSSTQSYRMLCNRGS